MSGESKFFDYEPLRRTKARKGIAPEEEGFRKADSAAEKAWLGEAPLKADRDIQESKLQTEETTTDTGAFARVLKRGHRLTYLGLFLFTVFLYVRPYETFPWLRGSTFWIAVATLAVFLPTQLGLDGLLTIRPREVNMVLLLFLFALLSIPFGTDIQTSWGTASDYVKVVLMFIVLVNVVRTELRLKLLILLVFAVSCALSIAAVNDYRTGNLELGGQRIKGIIGGMFDNPNDLALHLVTLIPIAISLIFASRAGLKKLFYAGCAVLFTAGMVVTFSRAGFLALLCAGAVLAWRIAQKNRWIVMFLPLILLGFIFFSPGGYGSRLSTTSDESATVRLEDLKRSIYVSLRHPIFGVGIGNYVIYSNKEKASHNSYTQVASELGLIALVVYVMFLITPIRELRKVIRETPPKGVNSKYHYLAIGLEASLMGYMVGSFFASVAFLWYVYYLVGFSIALRRIYAAAEPAKNQAIIDPLQRTRPVKSSFVGVS